MIEFHPKPHKVLELIILKNTLLLSIIIEFDMRYLNRCIGLLFFSILLMNKNGLDRMFVFFINDPLGLFWDYVLGLS